MTVVDEDSLGSAIRAKPTRQTEEVPDEDFSAIRNRLRAASAILTTSNSNQNSVDSPPDIADDAVTLRVSQSSAGNWVHPDSQVEPIRRRRHDSPDVAAIPSTQSNSAIDDSQPAVKRVRHDTPDLSPRRPRHDSPDLSPPHQTRHDSPDLSPRRKRHDSPDLSPPRNRHDPTDSLPRRHRSRSPIVDEDGDFDVSALKARASAAASQPETQTSNPLVGGLRTGAEFASDLRQKQSQSLSKILLESKSDTPQSTVFRDKSGRKLSQEEVDEMKRRAQEGTALPMQWKSGLAQQRAILERANDLLNSKMSVTADDESLNRALASQSRWDDPMAKRTQSAPSTTSTIAAPSNGGRVPRPIFRGHPWRNRFNIHPGYRWDGVDRTNGFELRLFSMQSDRQNKSKSEFLAANSYL